MPRRHSPHTLRKYSMMALAKHWDLICYSAHSVKEMNALLESEGYLNFEGPFVEMPSRILEDLMEVIRSKMSLNRKYLHMLILEQLQSLNLSLGIGEVFYGLHFLPRCKRLRDLNLSYVRHVEPSLLMKLIPHLTSLVTLNLTMTITVDPVLDIIAFNCPNLVELNLTSTMITDQGLLSLCGAGMNDQVKRCQKLQRLLITETKTTWIGALTILQHLPSLTDFDFDKIFQVFEHLDPKSVLNSANHPLLKLRSLYSTAPCVRGDSIDAAATLCPNIEILSIMNAWIDNDTFYKFMQFERLRTLTITNSEGLTIDYEEGVLPILQVIGGNLENLILNKFDSINVVSLGRSCPKLRKIALSSIKEYTSSGMPPSDELFKMLTIVELWSDEKSDSSLESTLLQLLISSVWLESLLIKNCDDISVALFRRVWMTNPMKNLNRLTLVECSNVEHEAIEELLLSDNDLEVLRIWSCLKIQREHRLYLLEIVKRENLSIYFEWFE